MILAARFLKPKWRSFLKTLSPREFDEWYALALLEGWAPNDEWAKVGTIAAEVHNVVRLTAANGLKFTKEEFRFPKHYYPDYSKRVEEADSPVLSAEESERRAEQRYGG